MAGKKKPIPTNETRLDPYKNFKFLSLRKAASGGKKLIRTIKASIDSAFLRRLR
jgi:hypothetical protein